MTSEHVARAHAHDPRPRRLEPAEVEALRLSPREVEVLHLLARGMTTREIADALYLSVNSIKTHTRSVFTKVGVATRTRAAVWVWSRPDRWWLGVGHEASRGEE